MASCIQAAEALVALGMRIQDVGAKEKKEALKLGKKVVWDIHLWRCTGKVWALDSREALIRIFQEACGHTHCDVNTVSQLTNGYRRICEEPFGGPPLRNLSAVSLIGTTQVGGGTHGSAGCHGGQ